MADIHFYKKSYKHNPNKSHGFTFPSATAELDFDTMRKLKMEPALKRFATKLLSQMDEKHIGIKILGIDFVSMIQK